MKTAVITFPGSNCDRDMAVAIERVTGRAPLRIWHGETALPAGLDMVAVPGGFTYGDYLRSGAMAARSPVMRAVADAARRGLAVLGVCNGFQILTEAQLLPGALVRNAGMRFVCRLAPLVVTSSAGPFLAGYGEGEAIALPVAHHDGNYVADAATLDRIEGEGLVALRYADDINGSARAIAGVRSPDGRILGMMPHPERRIEDAHGGQDGRRLFAAMAGELLAA